MKSTITKRDHRPVTSVACAPHVHEVGRHHSANLMCSVRFEDGSSYEAHAVIWDPSSAIASPAGYYRFRWDSPPPVDITRTALPRPAVSVAATGARSLFYARNLRPVVKALTSRFGAHRLILALALYPGELEAVIGAGGEARSVTAGASGTLGVGPRTTFEGSRSGIAITQLDPAVPQRLARLIAARGAAPTGPLDRFVLTFLPGDLAGWNIYPTAGRTRFQARLRGGSLEQISATGRRRLN
ncbi:MAG: hypothetical protein QOI73_3472 [Solirubrobacteraceae bacterium]|nr:hypothetical protein [Solirubrobacteraceae bacterium]